MTFPIVSFPFDLSDALKYDALANTPGGVYAYTGDDSINTEAAYNALVWLDPRTQPSYATLVAQKDDAGAGLAQDLFNNNYTADHNQIITNVSDIGSLTTSIGMINGTLSDKVPSTRTVNGHSLSSDVTITKGDLNLGNVDNTADASKTFTASQITDMAEAVQDMASSFMLASTGIVAAYNDGANTMTFTAPRTTSSLSLSLVGTGATGTQISSTKDSTIRCNVSTSTTSSIGGPSTSIVALKTCATNSATEGDWTTVAVLENDQTITLALALQSVQVVKGQLNADVPAGFYAKLVNSGTGTHAEAVVSCFKTLYG